MIKITRYTVKDVDETEDTKFFVLDEIIDNYESFNEICDFYSVNVCDFYNSKLVFQWDKFLNSYCYSIIVNELDSWGCEFDELPIYVFENNLSLEELEYIHTC